METRSVAAPAETLERAGLPRRQLLTGLLAAPGALALAGIVAPDHGVAKKKHKKKKKGKRKKDGGGGTPPPPPKSEQERFLELINEYRADNSIAPLTRQSQLDAAAQFHAEDMATHNYLGNTLSNGQTWDQNIANFGYSGSGPWGSSVAEGFETAAEVFQGWRNEPDYDAQMRNPDYQEIGIGRASSATAADDWYWVTTFGGG